MGTTRNRREFLTIVAGASAAALMMTPGGHANAARSPGLGTVGPTPTPAPIHVGTGQVAITMWVQDFGPAIDWYRKAAQAYNKKQPNVSITVQVIPYADLKAKVIPSVAAGTEADIIMGYNDWFVATDVSRLFLPLDKYVGGRAALEKIVFPKSLNAISTPNNTVYYLPFIAGLRAAVTTVNAAQYTAKGIHYKELKTWDDLVKAAKELTTYSGGRMTRSGLSPINGEWVLMKNWIWQEGGNFFNYNTGQWKLSTPEGEAAAQRLYDLFWKDRVCSFDLVSKEFDDFTRGRVSTELDGSWTVGAQAAAGLDVDAIVTPPLTHAKSDIIFPDEIAVITLSRRLGQDDAKRGYCIDLVKQMFSANALLGMTETYTGTLMSKALYSDPRITSTKYGSLSKRIATDVWSRARFPQDRVADQMPAQQELERALRKQIPIKQALANMEQYLNQQEQTARQRIKG